MVLKVKVLNYKRIEIKVEVTDTLSKGFKKIKINYIKIYFVKIKSISLHINYSNNSLLL
jgi:hypothetical protein